MHVQLLKNKNLIPIFIEKYFIIFIEILTEKIMEHLCKVVKKINTENKIYKFIECLLVNYLIKSKFDNLFKNYKKLVT